tara:strand:+ start:4073 stop:4735 length:663 start_codon:yes stop_codon:yes gene_type:complete
VLIIAAYIIYEQQVPFSERYHNETLAFQLRIDKNLVGPYAVFFGDSHIQGLAVQELNMPAINFGIGSDTSQGVLNRLSLYESTNNALFIYLAVGFNDLKDRSNEKILLTFGKIIEGLPGDKPVFISLLPPIDEKVFRKVNVTNSRINRLNEALVKFQKTYNNVTIVNPGLKLIDSAGSLRKQYHIGDGVHLSPQGYAVMIDYLNQTFRQRSLINSDQRVF